MGALGIETHAHQYRATTMLTQAETRILGCLLEKERATPDDYPLTANALMRAANQATSRSPVTSYSLGEVEATLTGLKPQGLVRFVFSPSNRATKYRHVLDEAWHCDDEELAVLCVLMLRGPQTAGELKSRAERLAGFRDVAHVEAVLGRLAARESPVVERLERLAGQKEPRWGQLLGEEDRASPAVAGSGSSSREDRLAALEAKVALLSNLLAEVRVELGLSAEGLSDAPETEVAS